MEINSKLSFDKIVEPNFLFTKIRTENNTLFNTMFNSTSIPQMFRFYEMINVENFFICTCWVPCQSVEKEERKSACLNLRILVYIDSKRHKQETMSNDLKLDRYGAYIYIYIYVCAFCPLSPSNKCYSSFSTNVYGNRWCIYMAYSFIIVEIVTRWCILFVFLFFFAHFCKNLSHRGY